MLKSTHKPLPWPGQPLLPTPWTEHTAPSGHQYYYNPHTKQSTYTRPVAYAPGQNPSRAALSNLVPPVKYDATQVQSMQSSSAVPVALDYHNIFRSPHRSILEDRPKSKQVIPGCAPWLLVKTRLGRRFVHNPTTNASFWKFPKDIISAVVEFDIQEKEERQKGKLSPRPTKNRNGSVLGEQTRGNSVANPAVLVDTVPTTMISGRENLVPEELNEVPVSDGEYEEFDTTDDEFEDDDNPTKRLKSSEASKGNMQQTQFNEEDMARQLAEMGQMYDLDPGEYGDQNTEENVEAWEEGAERVGLTNEEAAASFINLLDDFHVNPYTTWETIVAEGHVIDDDRYTLLPNMKQRKEVFTAWSAARIQQRKLEREKELKKDPRVAYLEFLVNHATPKLFWPEFKRKYKKEAEIKDPKLSDKEREMLYRSHIIRITKCTEETLKADLKSLLQSVPASASWNRSTVQEGLPAAVLADVRFISLKPTIRDLEIRSYIASLPSVDEISMERKAEKLDRRGKERGQREIALDRRGREVEEVKERQQKDLERGKRQLKEQERELSLALNIGKAGLWGHVDASGGSLTD